MRLVDMPGYGYAEAPKSKVKAWTEADPCVSARAAPISRASMCWSMRAMGSRTPTSAVFRTLDEAAVSYQIVLTKADQVKASELEARDGHDGRRARQAARGVSRDHGDLGARRRRNAGTARHDRAGDEGAAPLGIIAEDCVKIHYPCLLKQLHKPLCHKLVTGGRPVEAEFDGAIHVGPRRTRRKGSSIPRR